MSRSFPSPIPYWVLTGVNFQCPSNRGTYSGVIASGMLRWVCSFTVGNWDSASVGFTMRPGLAAPHVTYLHV